MVTGEGTVAIGAKFKTGHWVLGEGVGVTAEDSIAKSMLLTF